MSTAPPPAAKAKKLDLPAAVPKPDEAAYNKKIEAETVVIDAARRQLDELNEQLNSKSGGREEYSQQREGHRRRLDELNNQIESLENERKVVTGRVDEFLRSGIQARENAQKLKRELGFNSEQEIDKRIAEIEHHIMTSTLKLQEEKSLVREITALKNRRPLVANMTKQAEGGSPIESKSLTSMRARLDQIRDEVQSLRDLRRAEQEKLRDLGQARQQALAPLQDLYDQKTKIQNELSEHRQLKTELVDDLRLKMREYNSYSAKIRSAKQDAYREEQKRKVVERERQAVEDELALCDEPPLDPTHEIIVGAIDYIKRLIRGLSAKDEEPVVDEGAADLLMNAAESGQVAVLPKSQRLDNTPMNKKKRRAKKNRANSNAPLTHTFETLADFRTLDLEAPNTLDDCPGVLEALVAKEQLHEERRKMQMSGVTQKKAALLVKLKQLKEAELMAATPITDASGKTTSGAEED